MTEPNNRTLPPERKAAYYVGMALVVIGFLTFGSVFVSAALSFGDFSNFVDTGRSMFLRAVIGMGMIIAGGIVSSIGSKGLHGSGVLIDPQRQRQDMEPWSRMQGGMVDDALSEVKMLDKLTAGATAAPAPPATQVKVRCRACSALNDETDKFCGQCGAAL
jgi:polyferredoxin